MSNKLLFAAIATTFLTACGGGGDSKSSGGGSTPEPTPVEPTVFTGVFTDSPVEGLYYETETRSGLTNSAGEFEYLAGEIVTFRIGNTVVGSTEGTDVVTPFTLLGISPLDRQAQITSALSEEEVNSFDRALNIAAALQALDSDGNPDNGINLGESHSLLAETSINLLSKATEFLDDSTLEAARAIADTEHSMSFGNVVTHLYSSLGVDIRSNLVESYVALDNNQPLESISYTYDEQGNVTAARFDRGSDGSIDNVKSYTYDSNGRVSTITNTSTSTTERFTYSGDNLASLVIERSGSNNSEQNYTYDANDNLLRLEVDQDGDGNADIITHYSYDSEGNLTRVSLDRDGDGNLESNQSYVYENNQVATFLRDENNDGVPDMIIAYGYDANGNRTSFNVDITSDGFPDSVSTVTYDLNDNPTRFELDRDLDGSADYIESSRYDSNNNRIFYYRDNDADGTWDRISQYFYDLEGNQIRMVEDSDGNGIADKVWEGSYEPAELANGWNQILAELDL